MTATYQMGSKTPMTLFRENREQVCFVLREHSGVDKGGYVLLEGGKDVSFNDTDGNHLFRQESFFQYLFGVKEPDCFGVVQVATAQATLFVPRLPEEYATWMGRLLKVHEFKSMYEVDQVCYIDELASFFEKASPALILTLSGTNSDSGLTSQPARFDGIEKYVVNCDLLNHILLLQKKSRRKSIK